MRYLSLKFQQKIYLISSLIMLMFVVVMMYSWSNLRNIESNIEQLSRNNQFLNTTLLRITNIERLKRLIDNYTINGDDELIKPIDELLKQVTEPPLNTEHMDANFSFNYQQLLKSIQKFQESFNLARDHIPLNLALKSQLREQAQTIEDLVEFDLMTHADITLSERIVLEQLLNVFLKVEKSVVRYFESNERKYAIESNRTLQQGRDLIATLASLTTGQADKSAKQRLLLEKVEAFSAGVNQTIEHYRTYSMLTKVVIPGDAYEIHLYGQKLQVMTLAQIKQLQVQTQYYTEQNTRINFISFIGFTLLVLVGFVLIVRTILNPIRELTQMFTQLSQGNDTVRIPYYDKQDELGELIHAAEQFRVKNKQTKELLKLTQDYRDNLEEKVQHEIQARQQREKVLIQQSKLAAMGEMIGAIAHQWRQPLNELSLRIQKLKYAYLKQQVDQDYIEEFVTLNKSTIFFMSKTIDDFRNFFRIDKSVETFDLKQTLDEVINLQSAQLSSHEIMVEVLGNSFSVTGFKSEFQQAIMNFMSNSKDALITKHVVKPYIRIELGEGRLSFTDNAGGVKPAILERIFEPYFTTKKQGEGTGMGLYMSKMIIEDNMKGHLRAFNSKQGLRLEIEFAQEMLQ